MNLSELNRKSDDYLKNIINWRFFQAAYGGAKELIELGAEASQTNRATSRKIQILQKTKDSNLDIDRENRAYGFDYSPWVIDLISNFIANSEFQETMPEDEIFNSFWGDVDKKGTDYNPFWNDARRASAIFGKIGIFIDRPENAPENLRQQKETKNYAFYKKINPIEIYDYNYEFVNGSYKLSYLKFFQNNVYNIWTPEAWETWETDAKGNPNLLSEGINPLGEIPFVWFYNLRHPIKQDTGKSDISTISYIDASIIRDLTNADDIVFYAAFPMLAMPESVLKSKQNNQINVGPNQVIPYPAEGTQQPYWLASNTADSLNAIHMQIDKKEKQILRIAGLSAILSSESQDARSADSLKQMYKYLNAKLSEKVDNEIEARLSCLQFWLKWESRENEIDKISVDHDKNFDMASMIANIQDAVIGKGLVTSSETFRKEIDKMVVKNSLLGLPENVLEMIDNEIDNYSPPEIVIPDNAEFTQ